jgi:hypothetical protein
MDNHVAFFVKYNKNYSGAMTTYTFSFASCFIALSFINQYIDEAIPDVTVCSHSHHRAG